MMSVSASPYRGMSPVARRKRKRGMFIWGIVLLVVWFLCSAALASFLSSAPEAPPFAQTFLMSGFFGGLFFLLGLIFFVIGLVAELRARAFDREDRRRSIALTQAIGQLLNRSRSEAYASDGSLTHVSGATVIEVDRHFDQDTQGQVLTTINTTTRTFGVTHSSQSGTAVHGTGGMGTSSVAQSNYYGNSTGVTDSTSRTTGTEESVLSQTTRANLMGDALFSVFETTDASGQRDTIRAISLSRPAAEGVIRDLVGAVCYRVGGPETHSGGAVWAYVENVVAQFAPGDISYVTDRLKAIHSRPIGEREPVAIAGMVMGRNALLVTSLSINGAARLETYPARFPEMLAQALSAATTAPLAAADPRAAIGAGR